MSNTSPQADAIPTGAGPAIPNTAVGIGPLLDTTTCGALSIAWITSGSTTSPVTLFATNFTVGDGRPNVTPVPIASGIDLAMDLYEWNPVTLDPGDYVVHIEGQGISSTSEQFHVSLGTDISCLSTSPPATSATDPGPTPSPTQTPDPQSPGTTSDTASGTSVPASGSSSSSSGMNGGVIAGIVIGILAGALAIFLLACFFRRRLNQRQKRAGGDVAGSRWKNLGSVDLGTAAAGLAPAAVERHASGSSARAGGRASPHSAEEKFGFDGSGSSIENGEGLVAPLPFDRRGSGGSGGGHYQRALRPSNPSPTNMIPMAPSSSDPPVSRSDAAGTPARNGRRKAVPKYEASDIAHGESHELPPISPARSNPDLRHQGSFTFEKPVHYIMPDPPSQPR